MAAAFLVYVRVYTELVPAVNLPTIFVGGTSDAALVAETCEVKTIITYPTPKMYEFRVLDNKYCVSWQ